MKKLILLLALMSLVVGMQAQSIFKPVPKDLFTKKITLTPTVGTSQSVWIPRLQVGLTGESYELKKGGKVIGLDAVCYGIGMLHYKAVQNVPFNDFGFNLLLLQDIQTKGLGLGIYGTYNTGINIGGVDFVLNVGTHYDFTLKEELLDTGLTFHF